MRRLLRASRHRLRRGLHWLWAQEGTPGQRARGLAAGVFCGCFPFFGLQIVVSVGVASLLKGNPLLAAAGTLVSNPLTYLPLYWFNYLVGDQLLGPSAGADTLIKGTAEVISSCSPNYVGALTLYLENGIKQEFIDKYNGEFAKINDDERLEELYESINQINTESPCTERQSQTRCTCESSPAT